METVIERNNVVLAESHAPAGNSAVSWAAVFAGAVTAAALSLVMFILGIGLGLGAVSPWSGEGVSGTALGLSTILWITFTSLVASAAGGYITGRLRTRWLAVHSDEVFFRDTAHGFLAWGVATLLTAVVFTTATAGLAKMGVQAGAAVAGGVADTATTAVAAGAAGAAAGGDEAGAANPMESAVSYYLDTMFRTGVMNQTQVNALQVTPATVGNAQPPQQPQADAAAQTAQAGAPQQQGTQPQQEAAADAANAGQKSLSPAQQAALSAGGASPETMVPGGSPRRMTPVQQGAPVALPEVSRIFMRSLANNDLSRDDAQYMGRLVAQHTGLTEMEAEARVYDVFAKTQAELEQMETSAREAADAARSASMKAALWFFVSLLAGAFLGSFSATLGGRQRDF